MTENIDVLTHSSIRIKTGYGAIYFDPYQVGGEPHDAAYIFLTHDHYDHYSREDIDKIITEDTVIIVPERMAGTVAGEIKRYKDLIAVLPGVTKSVNGLEFETVPAYNTLKPFHTKGANWLGYVVTVDGQRIYVAGDTDATKEAAAVKCDIALVPIGGTYTMDAKKAAELVNTIKPAVAIPTHYGNIVGKPQDAQTFASLVKEPTAVEIKIQF